MDTHIHRHLSQIGVCVMLKEDHVTMGNITEGCVAAAIYEGN